MHAREGVLAPVVDSERFEGLHCAHLRPKVGPSTFYLAAVHIDGRMSALGRKQTWFNLEPLMRKSV